MAKRYNDEDFLCLAGDFAPIAASALRLLEDARVLRAARGYASAAGIAVLALEEVGKLVLHHTAFEEIRRTNPKIKGNVRDHRQKQKIVTELLVGNLLCSEVEHLLALAGLTYESVRKGGAGQQTSLVEALASIDGSRLSDEIGRMKNHKHHRWLVDLAAGRFDALKQHCFYSDRTATGWEDAGERVNRKTADKIVKLCAVAINAAHDRMRWEKRLRLMFSSGGE